MKFISKKHIPFIPLKIPLESSIKIENGNSNCIISVIIKQIRPSWKLDCCEIKFVVFTNGITNKIFCVSYHVDKEEKLIFRVFGAGSDKIIDRSRIG
ncbi:hypothetical protein Mgra_00002223 [Meloidogyne graminicola]|uniref:Uncharacterized protein n=1 Tax=Meloidogyne graminicola TaxID=189291 RepID=A0A8S9ZYB8_9BILA|nr:hypothetical protein Mgra_00002223 [Meloidogyne graminicola]